MIEFDVQENPSMKPKPYKGFETYPMYSLAHDDSDVFIIYSFIFGITSTRNANTHVGK